MSIADTIKHLAALGIKPRVPAPYTLPRSVIPSVHMPKFVAASSPVVVVVGDSISTPADITVATEYVSQSLYRKFRAECPGKTIQWYERGIGGGGWSSFMASSLASSGLSLTNVPWATPSSNSWLSFIEALAPDLIIWHFGQNTGVPSTEVTSFYSAMSAVKGWTKVPDMAFFTAYRPTLRDPAWNSVTQQEARDQHSAVLRGYALRNGHGLIDLNRWAAMCRDGEDILAPVFTRSRSNFGATISSSGPTNGTYTFSESGRDYALRCQLAGGSANPFRSGTAMKFRLGSWSGNDLEVSRDAGTGRFFVTIRALNSITPVTSYDSGVDVPASGDLYFEFVVSGAWAQIGFKGSGITPGRATPLWSGHVERFGGKFNPLIAYSGGQSVYINQIDVSNPTVVSPTITDTEMFGTNGGATGGNGINHPTSTAQRSIYDRLLDGESFA